MNEGYHDHSLEILYNGMVVFYFCKNLRKTPLKKKEIGISQRVTRPPAHQLIIFKGVFNQGVNFMVKLMFQKSWYKTHQA